MGLGFANVLFTLLVGVAIVAVLAVPAVLLYLAIGIAAWLWMAIPIFAVRTIWRLITRHPNPWTLGD